MKLFGRFHITAYEWSSCLPLTQCSCPSACLGPVSAPCGENTMKLSQWLRPHNAPRTAVLENYHHWQGSNFDDDFDKSSDVKCEQSLRVMNVQRNSVFNQGNSSADPDLEGRTRTASRTSWREGHSPSTWRRDRGTCRTCWSPRRREEQEERSRN